MALGVRRKLAHYLLLLFKQLLRNRLATCLIVLLIITAALILNVSVIRRTTSDLTTTPTRTQTHTTDNIKAPVFWIYYKTVSVFHFISAYLLSPSEQEQPLIHVMSVFRRLGYVQGGQRDSWDVLWSFQYPFRSLPTSLWAELKPHQRVNHFPGSGCFTFKPQLATMNFEFIPRAFQLPKQAEEFVTEVTAHPQQLWMKKDNNHRRINIVTDVKSTYKLSV